MVSILNWKGGALITNQWNRSLTTYQVMITQFHRGFEGCNCAVVWAHDVRCGAGRRAVRGGGADGYPSSSNQALGR